MPIKTLQQQQAQVGRIRIGQQVPYGKAGKTRPEKLDRFRFTTPSRQLADAVAGRYGGTVAPWQPPQGGAPEWEVVSTAKMLPVLVPPHPVTQWYELWSGAGCIRRCDGEIEQLSGEACKCPLDAVERGALAANGEACKATTRLKVMLPEIPGIGVWRIDTHGYYAAIELPQTAEFLGAATASNGYIKATLELQQRRVRRPGSGVRDFMVPVLHVDASPLALISGEGIVRPDGEAIGNTPRAAIAAADVRPNVQQETARIRDAALDATSPDVVRALWAEARAIPIPEEMTVGDRNGEPVRLYALLAARGNELAASTAVSTDRDELLAQITIAAAETGADGWAADFAAAYGVEPDDATVEQLQDALAKLRAEEGELVPPAGAVAAS